MLTKRAQPRFFFLWNSFFLMMFCLSVTPTKATAPDLVLWGPPLPKQTSVSAASVPHTDNHSLAPMKPMKAAQKTAVRSSRAVERISARDGRISVSNRDRELLARLVYAEGRGEPYEGQVAVAAVVLNRVESSQFPNTIPGVIFAENAFSPVHSGRLSSATNETARRAVLDAIHGADPSQGALYFFNPETATSRWIWSRKQTVRIANHVFAR
ncbi:cell wall hydrolase [Brevibacillus ruminantium]|uniref:Cell wall hydrolase n=1 Tax=Brevibacillus ruminantium TaxID=2950604 RepID=A0ABY4WLQ8_9BACL|nr:cell wall hydrolase [Brevibacillus ruminantium]USG68085.1 cell wall hydrolase [Brevibacillus ruminantium]